MKRPSMPALIDQEDRRIIGMGVIGYVVVLLALVGAALALGLSVRVFMLASGIGG